MSNMPGSNPSREAFKRDSQMWWRPGRLYIPAWQLSGIGYEATGAANVKSIGTGTPSATNMITAEVNTSGIVGLNFTTADNTVSHLMEIPADMDLSRPIYTSLYWTANNTSGSVDWEMFYKAFIANSTVLGSAEAATAFDKVGAAQTMAGVAFTTMRTPEMRIYGGKLPDTTELIQFTIQMHALVTITTVTLLGLAIRYTPHRLYYDPMTVEAKAPTYIGSSKYPNT
jgi:hypothetical protein